MSIRWAPVCEKDRADAGCRSNISSDAATLFSQIPEVLCRQCAPRTSRPRQNQRVWGANGSRQPSGQLARQILAQLGLDATGPPIARARARPHQERFDLHPEDPDVDPQYAD